MGGLSSYDPLDIPETYPRATDEVRQFVEDVAEQLEAAELTCVVQVDQLEDAARNTRTFEQLLAGFQSIGNLGEDEPAFILFLFGTPAPAERIDELRETQSLRLVTKKSIARTVRIC